MLFILQIMVEAAAAIEEEGVMAIVHIVEEDSIEIIFNVINVTR